jgi:predicted nucleic acid-binding protein
VEQHSEYVQTLVNHADTLASSVITFVETHAAFAAAERLGRISPSQHQQLKQKFKLDWPQLTQVEVTKDLLVRAAEFAQGFSLRAYDSLQLAAADKIFRLTPNALVFISFDQKLNQAAKLLGMQVSELI